MLKNKTKIIAIFLILVLLSSTFVLAANDVVDDNALTTTSTSEDVANSTSNTASAAAKSEDNYKKSDVYLCGDDITVDYIVDGNLFVCAKTVTINSQIGGDAFIIAEKVIVSEQAYIFSNLFTCAETLQVNGLVYDVYACAKNINISGYVYRDIKGACDTLTVNGTVGRNAFLTCSNINFNTVENSNGVIYGNLNYTSDSECTIPDGCVSGEVNFKLDSFSPEITTAEIVENYLLDLGGFIAFVLIIWLICLWLAPKFLKTADTYVGKKTLGVLGRGLLVLVAVPIACIILLILRLTSGISFVLLGLYILALVLSKAIFTIVTNKFICTKLKINKSIGIFGMLILSALIIWVLTELPYAGGIISFIITVLGLGVLVTHIIPESKEKLSEPHPYESDKTDNVKKISEKSEKSTEKKEAKKDVKKETKTKAKKDENTKKTEDK